MNKIKNYALAGLGIFLVLLAWQFSSMKKRYEREKAETERLQKNLLELMAQNKQQTSLILTKEEFLKTKSDSITDLLKKLAIKPRTVTKIVEREVKEVVHDTVPVFVDPVGDNIWQVADTGKCFIWQGEAVFLNNNLELNRTFFEYSNKTTDVFHRKLKFKIWFIKIYSRREIEQETVSTCGESTEKTITVIK